jgi:hypothetical protein
MDCATTVKGTEMAKLEKWLIILIGLHSVGVGCALMLAPLWVARFFGWGQVTPVFFARQAGIFHIVLAIGYVLEYFRYRGISLLITAKSVAFVFLLTVTFVSGSPWVVPFSGAADGLMGLVAYWVRRRVARGGA